jgi:hypothetical protein
MAGFYSGFLNDFKPRFQSGDVWVGVRCDYPTKPKTLHRNLSRRAAMGLTREKARNFNDYGL